MKSIKPGRAPSFMGGMAALFVSIFGIFWIFMAINIGAPVFFPIFGILFVIMGIANAIYNFKNATSQNRYSAFDITDNDEEIDPLNERFKPTKQPIDNIEIKYCPYCGNKLAKDFEYCPSCGKKIPD